VPAEPTQTTLELGVPIVEVTFCVVDLETTGLSPRTSRTLIDIPRTSFSRSDADVAFAKRIHAL